MSRLFLEENAYLHCWTLNNGVFTAEKYEEDNGHRYTGQVMSMGTTHSELHNKRMEGWGLQMYVQAKWLAWERLQESYTTRGQNKSHGFTIVQASKLATGLHVIIPIADKSCWIFNFLFGLSVTVHDTNPRPSRK